MRQGRHEALSNRIVDDVENDRDGVGRPLSCGSNRRAAADDEVRCRTHQLCRVSLDLTQISTRVSMLDSDIAVLAPAERLETLAKCNDPSQHFGIVLGVWMQECDAPHALTLPQRIRKVLGRDLKCSESLRALPACPTIPRRPYRRGILHCGVSMTIMTALSHLRHVRPKSGHSANARVYAYAL